MMGEIDSLCTSSDDSGGSECSSWSDSDSESGGSSDTILLADSDSL